MTADLFGHDTVPRRRPNGKGRHEEDTELCMVVHLVRPDSILLGDTVDSRAAKWVGRQLIDTPIDAAAIEHWRPGDVVRLILPAWKAQREGWI